MEEFSQIADQDFLKALDYADMHRYGFGDVSEVRPALTRAYSTAMEVGDRIECGKFLQMRPDFPATDDAITTLLGSLADNEVVNTKNLLYHWEELKGSGKVKPLAAEEIEAQQTQRPAPTLSGRPSGTQPADTVAEFEKLPLEQMREVLRKQGHLKY